MTQMVSAERAAALRNKCLNLTKTYRLGSGSASERTSQSRPLMSPVGTFRKGQASDVGLSEQRNIDLDRDEVRQ